MTDFRLTPRKGWCVVSRELPGEKTAGGIIKPPSALDRESGMVPGEDSTCRVEAVTPESDLRVGDRVVVCARGDSMVAYFDEEDPGTMITHGGRRQPVASLFVVTEDSVVAIVRREGTTE